MYSKIASRVVNFMYKNNSELDDTNLKEISTYGIEISLSTATNYILIIIIGICFHSIFSVAIFAVVFNTLRKFMGGYHCTTYFRCNITFCTIFILILTLSRLLCGVINISMIIMILMFCGYGIWYWGPVANIHKPISTEQKEHCHMIAKVIYVINSIMAIVCYIWLPYYGLVAIFSLLAVVVLLPLGTVAERRRRYESEK
ncbi:MAG: accessory gene regulator B family protein [Ruminococcus sp.]|nr:accessory gene regulator B family protein [Ruminococcus sp.]